MALSSGGGESGEQNQTANQKQVKKGIDIQALAERILRLLKEEARLEQERLGPRRT